MQVVWLVVDNNPLSEDADPIYGAYEAREDAEATAERLNREQTDPTWAMNAVQEDGTEIPQYQVVDIVVIPKGGPK